MNALVTGAGGFLGSYLVEQILRRGDRVRALCRGGRRVGQAECSPTMPLSPVGPRFACPTLPDASTVEIIHGDLRDRQAVVDACRGIDVVFHAGGKTGIGGRWADYYQANVLGTRHVVEGCLAHGVGRLVYTSSPSVTFDGRSQEGVDESVPYATHWSCHYPRSKALAEQCVLAANGQGGLLCCALRPHLIWGPRDRHLIPSLLADARAGRLRRIGDGTNRIDTVYVENAAAAHLLAADALGPGSPVAGRAYFISQGEPVNCWQWIDEILALAGLPPVRNSISPLTAWVIGAAYESFFRVLGLRGQPPMTRFLAAQLSTSHYFDITAARRDFGYEPKISMAEGMRHLAAVEL